VKRSNYRRYYPVIFINMAMEAQVLF